MTRGKQRWGWRRRSSFVGTPQNGTDVHAFLVDADERRANFHHQKSRRQFNTSSADRRDRNTAASAYYGHHVTLFHKQSATRLFTVHLNSTTCPFGDQPHRSWGISYWVRSSCPTTLQKRYDVHAKSVLSKDIRRTVHRRISSEHWKATSSRIEAIQPLWWGWLTSQKVAHDHLIRRKYQSNN